MKIKVSYPFNGMQSYLLKFFALLIILAGQNANAQVCSGYTIYALDNAGYIYPLNTSTATLQTPLNNSAGPVSGTSNPNGIGYSTGTSKFYYISKTNDGGSTFTSYNGTSTYATLSSFTGTGYPVTGAATSDGLGFYAIDYKTGALWYYLISLNIWTEVTTEIKDGATNLSTEISSNEQSGDLVEDGYGNLWVLMSGSSTYGLYVIYSPPTTLVASVSATQIISYTTSLPAALVSAGDTWGGAAFDAGGNLWLSSRYKLYEVPIGSTTPSLVGTFSGFKTGTEVTDLAQCMYTTTPLPLVWSSFDATLSNSHVDIDWEIAQASSVRGFYVERSNDSKTWDTLAFIAYANENLNYSFTDQNPAPGTNFYRIDESDYGNNSSYSIIKEVDLPSLTGISIWSNPATDMVHILYNGSSNNMTALIFDELGRNISKSAIFPGSNTISLSKIPPGTYFVLVEGANNENYYKQIIKERN